MKQQATPLLLVLLSLLLASCSSKVITFKTTEDSRTVSYKFKVPPGYQLHEVKGNHEREYNIVYPDSATLFISDNIKSGSFVNKEKFVAYGDNIALKILSSDTLTLHGTDNRGRYWVEQKRKNIIFGYINVTANDKPRFDSVLYSLEIQADGGK